MGRAEDDGQEGDPADGYQGDGAREDAEIERSFACVEFAEVD